MSSTLDDLILESESLHDLTYDSLLSCIEWENKRKEILLRDGEKCQDCGFKDASNHVHHTFYIKGCPPWDVPDACLVTLCDSCHNERHANEIIEWYQYMNGKLVHVNMNCSRCGGRGYFPEYRHVQGGVCFKCGGRGFTSEGVYEIVLNRKSQLGKK